MPPKWRRKHNPRFAGRSRANTGSTGRPFTSQPRVLGNQLSVGKIPLFPPRYRASLRYADTITLSSTSGAVASWVFAANGLYDPDITGTGHQPAGFDQMMLSYEHYCVTKARISATFHNNTTSVFPTVGLSVNAAATPVTLVNQIVEDGLVTTNRLYSNGVFGAVATLQRTIDIARFGGVDNILDDNTYRGTVASNPAELSYFILQLWDTESTTSTCSVDLIIEFEAVFTEPRKLTESLVKNMIPCLVEEEGKRGSSFFERPFEEDHKPSYNDLLRELSRLQVSRIDAEYATRHPKQPSELREFSPFTLTR